MVKWRIEQGDCIEVLRTLPEAGVHCVVTSPPYWGLRDYGVEGQLGMEPTPEQYVEHMVEVFREVRRVLRDDGTLWLNLGDSYAGSGRGLMGDGTPSVRSDSLQSTNRGTTVGKFAKVDTSGLKPKDLVGIPWRVAFALQADGWWLRSAPPWIKGSAMPESVTDRPTTAHEYIFLLSKSQAYYYDHEAVKKPMAADSANRYAYGFGGAKNEHLKETDNPRAMVGDRVATAGRNRRTSDYWRESLDAYIAHLQDIRDNGGLLLDTDGMPLGFMVNPKPFKGAHFATFPVDLVEPCIKAGTSEYGCCPECGAPWKRVVEKGESMWGRRKRDGAPMRAGDVSGGRSLGQVEPSFSGAKLADWKRQHPDRHIGWQPTCACEAGIIPCTVLDPFSGAGTTVLVANRLGRNAIGIELNPEYVEMARRRIIADAPLFAEAVL